MRLAIGLTTFAVHKTILAMKIDRNNVYPLSRTLPERKELKTGTRLFTHLFGWATLICKGPRLCTLKLDSPLKDGEQVVHVSYKKLYARVPLPVTSRSDLYRLTGKSIEAGKKREKEEHEEQWDELRRKVKRKCADRGMIICAEWNSIVKFRFWCRRQLEMYGRNVSASEEDPANIVSGTSGNDLVFVPDIDGIWMKTEKGFADPAGSCILTGEAIKLLNRMKKKPASPVRSAIMPRTVYHALMQAVKPVETCHTTFKGKYYLHFNRFSERINIFVGESVDMERLFAVYKQMQIEYLCDLIAYYRIKEGIVRDKLEYAVAKYIVHDDWSRVPDLSMDSRKYFTIGDTAGKLMDSYIANSKYNFV